MPVEGIVQLGQFKVVFIDGLNIALARPSVGRLVHEDLIACIKFFEQKGLKTYTILDDNEYGRDVFDILTSFERYTQVWLCTEADPVILELAKRISYSLVLSRDDYGQYQWRYGLVIFDPKRMFTFEWAKGPGFGRVYPRGIFEKNVIQLDPDAVILSNFGTILDILLQMPDEATRYAREFCKDIRKLLKQQNKNGAIQILLNFVEILIDIFEARSLDKLKMWRISRHIHPLKDLCTENHELIERNLQQISMVVKRLSSNSRVTSDKKRYIFKLWEKLTSKCLENYC
jgi:hypothetical protein